MSKMITQINNIIMGVFLLCLYANIFQSKKLISLNKNPLLKYSFLLFGVVLIITGVISLIK